MYNSPTVTVGKKQDLVPELYKINTLSVNKCPIDHAIVLTPAEAVALLRERRGVLVIPHGQRGRGPVLRQHHPTRQRTERTRS